MIKHGFVGTRIYDAWKNMRQRCLNARRHQFKDYGGRGIRVDSSWDNFETFLADMGEPPLGYSLERIDNNGIYCKTNCRWAPRKEQNRNKRNNRIIEFDGQKKCLAEWAEELGLQRVTLIMRLDRGWPPSRALTGRKYNRWDET